MYAVSSQIELTEKPKIAVAFSRGLRRIRHIEKLAGVDYVLSASQAKKVQHNISCVLVWGRKSNTQSALSYAKEHDIPVIYLEDGWIRSSSENPHSRISYSLLKDHTGVYYDATTPCDLEDLLNLDDQAFKQIATDEKLAYARENRARLVASNITKYNFTSLSHGGSETALNTAVQGEKRILVIDQTMDDASVRFGGMDASSFEKMLHAAIDENPDAEVVVRVHPDVVSGRRRGYLSDLAKSCGIRVSADSVNPMQMLKVYDRIYVGTSQLGYEALLCDKDVTVFGQPFYASWGLTDDRAPVTRRTQRRSIDELFFASHIALARYCNPVTGEAWQLHECLAHVELQQSMFAKNAYDFECEGISAWKRQYVKQYLRSPDGSVTFVKQASESQAPIVALAPEALPHQQTQTTSASQAHAKKSAGARSRAKLTWGYRRFSDIDPSDAQKDGELPVFRLEDGFLRSTGLGSDFNAPASLVLDGRGLYFDPTRPSDLETMLDQQNCTPKEIFRAISLKKLILSSRLSKYNVGEESNLLLNNVGQDHILVVGQVEDDESIKRGCDGINKNADLLIAVRRARPDAWIRYKPHPDVVAGNRQGAIDQTVLDEHANAVDAEASIVDCIEACDELHTMTSLSGFEALLRGKRVVTYGAPFYAGWGLTEDRQPIARRTRRRTLDELVYLTLIAYPRYVDIETGEFTTPEDLVQTIISQRTMNKNRVSSWSAKQLSKVANIVKGLRYAP